MPWCAWDGGQQALQVVDSYSPPQASAAMKFQTRGCPQLSPSGVNTSSVSTAISEAAWARSVHATRRRGVQPVAAAGDTQSEDLGGLLRLAGRAADIHVRPWAATSRLPANDRSRKASSTPLVAERQRQCSWAAKRATGAFQTAHRRHEFEPEQLYRAQHAGVLRTGAGLSGGSSTRRPMFSCNPAWPNKVASSEPLDLHGTSRDRETALPRRR